VSIQEVTAARRPQLDRRLMWQLAAVIVLVASPFFGIPSWTVSTAVLAGIFGLAALAVNVLVGFGRMVNLGGAAFLGLAAYGAVLGSTHFGIPYTLAAVAAVVAAALVAWLVGGVLAKLPGFYFAVAMLGVSSALQGVLEAFPSVTDGDSGLTTIRTLPLGVVTISSNAQWYATIVVITVIAVLLTHRLVRSWRGRLLALVREDPLAASVHGVDVRHVRRVLFTVSAVLAALSGVLLARWEGVIVPQDAGLVQSVQLLGFAIVGGMGSLVGPALGASLLTWLSNATSGLGNIELLVYGLIFFVVVAYVRGGVAGLPAMVRTSGLVRRLGLSGARPSRGAAGAGEPGALGGGRGAAPGQAGPPDPGPATDVPAFHGPAIPVPAAGAPVGPGGGRSSGGSGLTAVSLSKSFGGVRAVDDVTLEAAPGCVTAIVGGNGAGKSTVLNMISGVEAPSSGKVIFDGRELSPSDPVERARLGIGRTFQTARVAPDLTVEENVRAGAEGVFGLALLQRSRRPGQDLADRCREALSATGLEHIAHRRMAEIGGGQRKLVEVARALALRPKLLLMDEPGAGLTLEELSLLAGLIRRLRASGTAVLIIDHNLDFVAGVADGGYVLDLGRVAYAGDVAGLRKQAGGPAGPIGAALAPGGGAGG
jgi:ABC-type branched-subunit amino acid transport system ATPase component/ABC-type branched-subunit amino acid transport system permease subunit